MHAKIKKEILRGAFAFLTLIVAHYLLLKVGLSALYPLEAVEVVVMNGTLQSFEFILGFSGTMLAVASYGCLMVMVLQHILPQPRRRHRHGD